MPMEISAAFDDLARALVADPDDDVTVADTTLSVKGVPFAVLAGDALLVDLPYGRSNDLVDREVAAPADGPAPAKGRWVSVSDIENWRELAGEAHQFVGEPAFGGDS
jgi:hypothetical protein